jgi:uncharacterized protein YciI
VTLSQFTAEVNRLSQAHCDRLNKEHAAGRLLFGAKHHDFSEAMVSPYWRFGGYTPRQALKAIQGER